MTGESSSLAQSMPPFALDQLAADTAPKLLTLVMVNQNGRLLLGLKKRGFGSGFYNGFGGKVEPGETVDDAAVRELKEEAGIVPRDITLKGILNFLFDDQARPWEVHVYEVNAFDGTPTESDEMQPQWFDHDKVPFDRMWADDVHWYPLFLAGHNFLGAFAFTETTKLVWHRLERVEQLSNEPFLQSLQSQGDATGNTAATS